MSPGGRPPQPNVGPATKERTVGTNKAEAQPASSDARMYLHTVATIAEMPRFIG